MAGQAVGHRASLGKPAWAAEGVQSNACQREGVDSRQTALVSALETSASSSVITVD